MTSPPGSRVTTCEPAIRRQPYQRQHCCITCIHRLSKSILHGANAERPTRVITQVGRCCRPREQWEGTRCPVASSSPAFSYDPYRRPTSGPRASRRFRPVQSLLSHTRRLSPRRTRRCQSGRHAPGKVVATRSRSSSSRVCCSISSGSGSGNKKSRVSGVWRAR